MEVLKDQAGGQAQEHFSDKCIADRETQIQVAQSSIDSAELGDPLAGPQPGQQQQQQQQQHRPPLPRRQQSASISSSSSSMLTNSSSSPTNSLASIPTNSPTASTTGDFSSALTAPAKSHSISSASISLSASIEPIENSAATTSTVTVAQQQHYQSQEPQQQQQLQQAQQDTLPASRAPNEMEALDREPLFIEASATVPVDLLDANNVGRVEQILAGARSLDNDNERLDHQGEELEEEAANASGGPQGELSASQSQIDALQGPVDDRPEDCNRHERSNSCSQAERGPANMAAASAISALGAIRQSHDNLAATAAATVELLVVDDQNAPHFGGPTLAIEPGQGDDVQIFQSPLSVPLGPVALEGAKQASEATATTTTITALDKTAATTAAPQAAKQTGGIGSSRFFSSKLNTGSLWSLLSVGSNSSTTLNESANSTQEGLLTANNLGESQPAGSMDEARVGSSGFLSRVNQFKRHAQQSSSFASSSLFGSAAATTDHFRAPSSSASLDHGPSGKQHQAANSKRYRFNVKYIGSALLHKNFTLPMLEWIAKDIRRQTIKGAQSISQRQFTMPTRDIIFELQASQLTAISCKDGHCIFMHPMHRVSKYVQLQHDPTSFAYIIKDSKESPSFCHVFQAKSANKIHDIFSAIREATTRNQHKQQAVVPQTPIIQTPAQQAAPSDLQQQVNSNSCQQLLAQQSQPNRLQKSASTDGHWRSNLLPDNSQRQLSMPSTPPPGQSAGRPQQAAGAQFESSYQFEVMFVKRLKLQCRRVPPTFVDDALETLKSFEVLKGGGHLESKSAQIKASVGKRIINASVDERQEYDQQEHCSGSPVASGTGSSSRQPMPAPAQAIHLEDHRRGSSASLNKGESSGTEVLGERESKSCQQSPAKSTTGSVPMGQQEGTTTSGATAATSGADEDDASHASNSSSSSRGLSASQERANCPSKRQHHQSMDSLQSIERVARSVGAKSGQGEPPPSYANDFSPYNTITSSDLNERIAQIPVVSSSVSLDHETRQKLARQVRETIMATAATIKKGVYASGDKLDSSTSSKALDSLSCNVVSSVPPPESELQLVDDLQLLDPNYHQHCHQDQRRSSAGNSVQQQQQTKQQVSNNFDLFRRASARQVVKNRTMLLLIGKDELCAISTDKYQMLFSKSFNSIVHCLQGSSNRDHFGLICRDSGKINPMAEAYAGFVFKCQSEKVVREIMGALRQVIYSSQYNYHGYNSPYNPLNTIGGQYSAAAVAAPVPAKQQESPKLDRQGPGRGSLETSRIPTASRVAQHQQQQASLAAKRGFVSSIEMPGDLQQQMVGEQTTEILPTAPPTASAPTSQTKNPIRSMFCDNCPLYWYHRLCCDVESLPAEASKAIILRRIDSSLTDKEQDEMFTRFSEFSIDSVEEHNEIFMSILRHQSERKQLRHSQSPLHQTAMARAQLLARQSAGASGVLSKASAAASNSDQQLQERQQQQQRQRAQSQRQVVGGSPVTRPSGHHQRSGSTSGSLAYVIGQSNAANQSIADAGSAAIDNLKRAKNSISVSIENMLKRRSSMRDEAEPDELAGSSAGSRSNFPLRSGSFKSSSREACPDASEQQNNLKRSQSTSDYWRGARQQQLQQSSWKDSLTRTINDDNPLVGLFRRRNSMARHDDTSPASNESLASGEPAHQQPGNPHGSPSRQQMTGGSSPSSVLSGAFWKKSIFDKIRHPVASSPEHATAGQQQSEAATGEPQEIEAVGSPGAKRTREELRALWRKAILEQITLLKMDKQNQQLQAAATSATTATTAAVECNNVQRVKLNYRDVPYSIEALGHWDRLLKQDPTVKVEFAEVARIVRLGVPKHRRGEAWMFLMNQYQLRHGTSFQPADSEFRGNANQTYRSLLSQLSTQQHEIFVDIGKYSSPLVARTSSRLRIWSSTASVDSTRHRPRGTSRPPYHHL